MYKFMAIAKFGKFFITISAPTLFLSSSQRTGCKNIRSSVIVPWVPKVLVIFFQSIISQVFILSNFYCFVFQLTDASIFMSDTSLLRLSTFSFVLSILS